MKLRLVVCIATAVLAACAGRGPSSAARPAAAQPLIFTTMHGRDSGSVRYRGVAYVRRNEIDVVLREGQLPATGPFTGTFTGFSVALASGDPGWPRVELESDYVDEKNIHFADGMLADSVVLRFRGVKPDAFAGMWFVLHERRVWRSDSPPRVVPIAIARSTDVFRPGGAPAPAPPAPNGR